MTLLGHVEGGRVVLLENIDLPDGTPVRVVIDSPDNPKKAYGNEKVTLQDVVGILPKDLEESRRYYHEAIGQKHK